jgi:hypothetical protein
MKVGDIVSARGKSCKITEQFEHCGRTLFHAHYIDTETGRPMACPDRRCNGEHTCPIHGSNITASEATPISAHDIRELRKFGIRLTQRRAR